MGNFISANRKGDKLSFSTPIGRNKIVPLKKLKNLGEIIVSLFLVL